MCVIGPSDLDFNHVLISTTASWLSSFDSFTFHSPSFPDYHNLIPIYPVDSSNYFFALWAWSTTWRYVKGNDGGYWTDMGRRDILGVRWSSLSKKNAGVISPYEMAYHRATTTISLSHEPINFLPPVAIPSPASPLATRTHLRTKIISWFRDSHNGPDAACRVVLVISWLWFIQHLLASQLLCCIMCPSMIGTVEDHKNDDDYDLLVPAKRRTNT